MLAQSIMISDFPEVDIKNNTEQISELAFEFDIFHIPITENGQFVGILPFDILGELDILEEKPLAAFKEDFIVESIGENNYLFEGFTPILEHELTAIPVVNEKKRTQGNY